MATHSWNVTDNGVRAILENDKTFATELLAIAMDKYGADIMEWEPETLRMAMQEDFSVELPEINCDKLQALITAYTTNLFFKSAETFHHICGALSNYDMNVELWEPLAPEVLLWGMYEVLLNVADTNMSDVLTEFSDEVRAYIGVSLNEDGMADGPDLLAIGTGGNNAVDQWADDEVMFKGVWQNQQDAKTQVLKEIGVRLTALVVAIDTAPLGKKGKDWEKFKKQVIALATRMLQPNG